MRNNSKLLPDYILYWWLVNFFVFNAKRFLRKEKKKKFMILRLLWRLCKSKLILYIFHINNILLLSLHDYDLHFEDRGTFGYVVIGSSSLVIASASYFKS